MKSSTDKAFRLLQPWKPCPNSVPEMIAGKQFHFICGLWPGNLPFYTHNNYQHSERVFACFNAGLMLRVCRLKQLHKSVSNTNKRHMRDDCFGSSRFTLTQTQILFGIPEQYFYGSCKQLVHVKMQE